MAVRYNLWPFGVVCRHLLYFFPIRYVWTKKNLATLVESILNFYIKSNALQILATPVLPRPFGHAHLEHFNNELLQRWSKIGGTIGLTFKKTFLTSEAIS
jgi:hypothetical protein